MAKFLTPFGVFCVVVAAAMMASAAMLLKPTIVPAGSAKFAPVAGITGLSEAVLYGTPSKAGSGVFTERYKTSSDVTFPAHTHPTDELVTVLNGTLLIGVGDKVDAAKTTTLTAGGFIGIPAGVHHFGILKAGSVIDVSGLAPDTMNIIKPGAGSM
jgi:quercetin dioxygenase-like cupin family protein